MEGEEDADDRTQRSHTAAAAATKDRPLRSETTALGRQVSSLNSINQLCGRAQRYELLVQKSEGSTPDEEEEEASSTPSEQDKPAAQQTHHEESQETTQNDSENAENGHETIQNASGNTEDQIDANTGQQLHPREIERRDYAERKKKEERQKKEKELTKEEEERIEKESEEYYQTVMQRARTLSRVNMSLHELGLDEEENEEDEEQVETYVDSTWDDKESGKGNGQGENGTGENVQGTKKVRRESSISHVSISKIKNEVLSREKSYRKESGYKPRNFKKESSRVRFANDDSSQESPGGSQASQVSHGDSRKMPQDPVLSYRELRQRCQEGKIEGLVRDALHLHMTPEEFERIFEMRHDDFECLSLDQRISLKKKAKLVVL